MKTITYPITLEVDEEDKKILNVTIPNIMGAYTFGEGYKDAIFMAKDLLKLMVEECPEQCFPPESVEEVKESYPIRKVETISIKVSDEVYRNYQAKMVTEVERISINVLIYETKDQNKVRIQFPEAKIDDIVSDDVDKAVDLAEKALQTTIRTAYLKIHAPTYSQGELRRLCPGASVLGIVIYLSKDKKEKILLNFPEIDEPIRKKNIRLIHEGFKNSFYNHRLFNYHAISRKLIDIYEAFEDKQVFLAFFKEVYEICYHSITEGALLEFPIPFLFTLKEYDFALELLSHDKRDYQDPYISLLKGITMFYLHDYYEAKEYLLLASKDQRYHDDAKKFLDKLEKKVLPPKH